MVRAARLSHRRISILHQEFPVTGPYWPRVFDADTGQELTREIRANYAQRLSYAKKGETVRFERLLLKEDGRPFLSGGDVAKEIVRGIVMFVEGPLPPRYDEP